MSAIQQRVTPDQMQAAVTAVIATGIKDFMLTCRSEDGSDLIAILVGNGTAAEVKDLWKNIELSVDIAAESMGIYVPPVEGQRAEFVADTEPEVQRGHRHRLDSEAV